MGQIKVMDELLSNQIAAGEVVEKCLSIVKELVENSLDAGADKIKVSLKESGLREIKVVDNGKGMSSEDAELCFTRHATSKLYFQDDLFNITSLGFRGEALPSIASISSVELKTCNSNIGTYINIKGGKIIEKGECDINIGTSITVTSLFYNTPARLKFLKSPSSELSAITEFIHKIALSFPNKRFILINDDKEIFASTGSNNLLQVIHNIYGSDVSKKMIPISGENSDYLIKGYISLPEVNRSSKSHMTVFVNNRLIRNTLLFKTINDAYSSFKEDTRYPIVVISIETDPRLIDVNIHPSKQDIKFSNFDELRNLITEVIISAIKTKLLIPKIALEEVKKVNYENTSIDFITNTVKEDTPNYEYKSSLEEFINNSNNECLNEYVEEADVKNPLPELYPVGLAFGTYIICQNEKGLYLIDQHAAKERVNYERVSYKLSHPSSNVIEPIIPIIIELPLSELIILRENISIFDSLNIKLEIFGTSSLRVISHPTWFTKGREVEIMKNIISEVIRCGKDFELSKFRDNLAKLISCKMSIKANTNISTLDMENLISDMRSCENPYNCPHGRPTIINFTKYELEKMFKRSI